MDEPDEKRRDNSVWIILFSVILMLIMPWLFTRDFGLVSFEGKGNIGDTIGGITSPIVGLLGAILVYKALQAQISANNLLKTQFDKQQKDTISALRLQADSNNLMRQQTIEQEKATKRQIADAEAQSLLTLKQSFESSFFQMLMIHHDIVQRMKADISSSYDAFVSVIDPKDSKRLINNHRLVMRPFSLDREVFKDSSELLIDLINTLNRRRNHDPEGWNPKFEAIKFQDKTFQMCYKSVYMRFYETMDTNLGHYFRNLYRIVKMIDQQKFHGQHDTAKEFETRYHYTSIIRAQLSDYEVIWLFFNGLGDHGRLKFKPLIEKYALLKILDSTSKTEIQILKGEYKDSAFKKHNPWLAPNRGMPQKSKPE